MEQKDIVNMQRNNLRYEILTPTGYKTFEGVRRVQKDRYMHIIFSDRSELKCSLGHKLYVPGSEGVLGKKIKRALVIRPGDNVYREQGETLQVQQVSLVNKPIILYDAIEVSDGHKYFTNNVVSSNCDCDFLTSGDTFFDVEDMSFYEQTYQQDPVERRGMDGNLWIWEYPDYSKSYMVSADVARGDGGDNSAFQVWDIEACTQVAEYMGQLPPREFGAVLTSIATEYNNALLVVENANVGFSAIEEIMARQYPNLYYGDNSNTLVETAESYAMKSDKGRLTPGFNTSTKTRPVLLAKYYDYVRQKAVIIRSKRLLLEMRTFVWLNGKAQGAQGYHDDLVMSAGIGLYVRDTALRLRQQGMDLSRAQMSSFTNLNKRAPVVVQNSYVPNPYEMKNPYGQVEDITWLLR